LGGPGVGVWVETASPDGFVVVAAPPYHVEFVVEDGDMRHVGCGCAGDHGWWCPVAAVEGVVVEFLVFVGASPDHEELVVEGGDGYAVFCVYAFDVAVGFVPCETHVGLQSLALLSWSYESKLIGNAEVSKAAVCDVTFDFILE